MTLLQTVQSTYRAMLAPGKAISGHPELAGREHVWSIASDMPLPDGTVPDVADEFVAYAAVYGNYVWVRKAVSKVSEAFASLPVNVVNATGDPQPNDPLTTLLNRGNDATSPAMQWQKYTASMLLGGENFFEIVDSKGGMPVELWQRPPHKMNLRADISRALYPRVAAFIYEHDDDNEITLAPESVIHDKFHNPLSVWRGLAPIAAVREGIIMDLFARAWRKKFMKNSARPDMAIVAPQGITPSERTKILGDFLANHQGIENSHLPVVLEEGITDIKPFSWAPKDIEWLQQQEFSRDEIGAVFGVPDEIMGYGKDTYENFQTALEVFWTLTIKPLAEQRDSTLTHFFTFVRPLLPVGFRIATDFTQVDVFQEDLGGKLDSAIKFQALGVDLTTINERLELGIDPARIAEMESAKEQRRQEALAAQTNQPPAQGGGVVQRFFTPTGKATRRLPGEDGNDQQRKELENYHADKLQAALRRILRAVAPSGTTVDNITPDEAISRYRATQGTLRDALVEMLMDGAQMGADIGIAQAEWLMGIRKAAITGVNWDLVNEAVLRWVLGGEGFGFGNGYADVVTQALASTSETQIRRNIAEWINNELPYNVLVDNLERAVFSRRRAETIATTEITRSYAVGNELSWQESRVIGGKKWNTARDEIVCSICRPLNGVIAKLGEEWIHPETQQRYTMPAHPKDRCWSTPVPTEDML